MDAFRKAFEAGDGVRTMSSEYYGDEEGVLHLASTESGMLAVLSTSHLVGDAAYC